MKPYLSVLIPTYNRAQKLDRTLAYLHDQSLSSDSYEIIVVDDGSTDETERVLKKWANQSSLVQVLKQKNSGQGVARNKALKRASGEIILFIGDDIYATPDFLLTHVQFHQDHPEENKACLGLTEWEAPTTPFMQWLTHGGPQFAYDQLNPQREASFWFFYTSNLSLKRSLLQKETFDEDFKAYGWEDIELGYRLMKKHDLKMIYTPQALATHDHPMEEKDLERKMKSIGKTALVFQKKHPEVRVLPQGIKLFIFRVLSLPPLLWIFKFLSKRFYWYASSKRYFLQGLGSL